VSVRARRFSYEVSLDRDWVVTSSRGGTPLPHEEEDWTPEHLVLAALGRCVLTSFRYHARRAGLEPLLAAAAEGSVTRREEDGRFAFAEIRVDVDARLDPAPARDVIEALVAKGERDCFIGASLTVKPDYHWTVNGEELP
jgi:organic hydroperoxide reductase OsmC/OhrA